MLSTFHMMETWKFQQEELEIEAAMTSPSLKTLSDTTSTTSSKIDRMKGRNTSISNHATTGPGWFYMKNPPLTSEIKRDVHMVHLRAFLDPKRFYKKDDVTSSHPQHKNVIPKHFQLGTLQDDPAAYYSDRVPRKERKEHLIDELLQDATRRRYVKRKFNEIQRKRNTGHLYRRLKKQRYQPWKTR
jgi:hypothetical protein